MDFTFDNPFDDVFDDVPTTTNPAVAQPVVVTSPQTVETPQSQFGEPVVSPQVVQQPQIGTGQLSTATNPAQVAFTAQIPQTNHQIATPTAQDQQQLLQQTPQGYIAPVVTQQPVGTIYFFVKKVQNFFQDLLPRLVDPVSSY